MISIQKIFLPLFLIITILSSLAGADDLIQAPAALHISSNVSDGNLSVLELADLAQRNGLKVVVLGDHYDVSVTYGLRPLRDVLKKTVSGPSVRKFGVRRYLAEVEEAQQKHPNLIILPGVEHTAHYFWEGNPFKGTLQLNNWHKHLLVLGLDEKGFKGLPAPDNGYGVSSTFDPLSLWPFLLLFAGLACLKKRAVDFKGVMGVACGPYSKPWRRLGYLIIAVSVLFLINNFPFTKARYSRYEPARDGGPYQTVIDHVNEQGGAVFWAHPEANYSGRRGKVLFKTWEYARELLRLKDYTGFALYYEGYEKSGIPGGIWDLVLGQYCNGERARPSWAMAELDFEGGGSLDHAIKDLKTVLLLKELNAKAVLEALKTGKMYVVRGQGPHDMILDEFSVQSGAAGPKALMGEELTAKGTPTITVRGHFAGASPEGKENIEIKLIRNGQVVLTQKSAAPFAVEFKDEKSGGKGMDFYRLEIRSPQKTLLSNPIFVRFPF